MKQVSPSVLQAVAWIVFLQLVGLCSFAWSEYVAGHLDFVLAFAFSFASLASMPLLPSAGWGVWKGGSLCKNRPTYLIALGIHLLFSAAFWSYVFGDGEFDKIFAFGMILTGLMLVRSYSDWRKSTVCES